MEKKKLKENGNKSFVVSTVITLLIILMLILSGPIAGALKVTLSANKPTVQAGAAGDAGNITFTTWVNLSSPDAYVPLQRIFLNLSGPRDRSFSFNPSGGDIMGNITSDEITVVASSPGFGSSNYGIGYGYGYGYNTGITYPFGYGYGYGGNSGAGDVDLNVSYTITLNTSYMYDGNYTATTNVYAADSSTSHDFTSTESIDFTVLPRVFTETIDAIPANNVTTPVLIQSPVGNITYTIETGSNATPAVTLNVTVQVSPPTINGSQVAAVNGSGGLAGAFPSLYFNYSVDDPTWYDNITYILINMSYDPDNLPAGVLESTLRPARYLTTTSSWVRLTCPTCPRTLETVNDTDGILRDVNLIDSGVDETGNYVWAKVNHFSTFAIAGTVTTTATTNGGGGTGTGGGGVSTSEPFENIEKAERHEKALIANQPVTYTYSAPELGIYEITVTGQENENDIALRVETLKGTSKLVTASPPGAVYKNVNVWAGTKRIKDALIRFKVDNSWLTSNNIPSGNLKMVRWDGGKWVQLDTTQKTKDTSVTYYEAKTGGFSVFAIVGLKEGEVLPTEGEAVIPTATPVAEKTPVTEATEKESPGFGAISVISALVLMAALRMRNRERR